MQQNDDFCICIQSVSLCVLIGELRPFILRDVNDHCLLVLVSLVFVVGDVIVCPFHFFWIC